MPSIAFTEPDMTCNDSSDDSIRRLTDDFGRHRLTDVLEADESEEDTLDYYLKSARRKRHTSFGSTASSTDGLWELHPRRLSEAGLSRHSDSSAVLTEDTDSFMIGQRVWVGGTKPGTIAYIGETQFAPGEWAGIALDEPIGKNDGSVGGIKYFQCENKKGVFSRLTRLTRVPLEQPGMGSNETFTSPTNGVRSPISPTGSTKGLLKSAMSLSNSSLTSSATHVDFKIGDRVIIKSTQGSKVGTVRYMGLTDFAPGEWVGVELDDPRGKNDGSVAGKRYFECRPNFGLFAPISKISKSPSKYKPSACVVHSGTGLPPSGLKRTNSKESMTSMASKTSAASSVRRVRLGVTSLTPKKVTPKTSTPIPTRTALQDVLREKQQHIEQLLKERDLERAEITRASSQADEAEQRFLDLKQDFEKYRSECESKVRESSELLSKLKIDREEVLNQLEEEKRKNEDLQFKFEEAAITKSDIEVINDNYMKRIGQLEAKLEEERQRTETLESTSNKLFEAEENLIKTREEVESLKQELGKIRKERSEVEEERTVTAKLVESLQKEIEGASIENAEKSAKITQLSDEISKVTSEHELVKREVEEIKKKATDSCQEKDEEIKKLKAQLENQEHIIEKYEKTHEQLLKENDRLKMELSAKIHDVESVTDQILAKDAEIKSVQSELDTVKKELSHKIDDLERHKANSIKVEEDLRKELEQTREDLKQKITEVENVKKERTVQTTQMEQQLQEANKTIAQNVEEIKKLTNELSEVKVSHEESKKEIHSRHARQVASQDSQLMALSAELQQKNEEITKCSIVISKLEEDLCAKNSVIEKLRLELESYQSHQSTQTEASSNLTIKLNELTLSNGDLQRQLLAANQRISELLQLRQRLETEVKSLSVKGENSVQLEQLRNEIQAKEQLLEAVKAEFEEKLQSSERRRHEHELQLQTTVAAFEQLRTELGTKLQVSLQSEEMLRQRCDNTVAEIAKARDEYRIKIDELKSLLTEKERALANLDSKSSESLKYYEEQLKSATQELNRNLQGSQIKISALTDETVQLKEELARRSEELIKAKAETSHISAQCQQIEKELKQTYGEHITRLEFELNGKNLELKKNLQELELVKSDCQNANVDVQAKDRQISELTAEVQQAQNVVTQLQEQLTLARSLCQQTTQQHVLVQNQCQGLLDQVASLTEQVRTGEEIFRNLQIEHKNALLLVNRLKITEQQKQQCLQQLQQEVSASAETKNCGHVMELLNQIKVDSSTGNAENILGLQKDIEIIRNQLAERNHQYDLQQSELLRLQEELLKAQESNSRCTEGQRDQNSVSLNDTYNTKHIHQPQPSNPLELQVQLTMLKHSFIQLSTNFEKLRNENSYLLARLQNALNAGNGVEVHNMLIQLTEANVRYQNFRHTMEVNNFNLQKVVQHSMLQLQEKDRILNDQKVQIKNLQQIVQNLPMQCKQFTVLSQNASSSECASLIVDNTRINNILRLKEEHILELKKQISSLLNEQTEQSENKVCIQQPCLCPKQETVFKSVITPSPPKIIRVMVPVVQPKVLLKKVLVPQVNGYRCPTPRVEKVEIPKVIIQKVPFEVPVPSKCILPDLTSLYDCSTIERTVGQLDLSNYSPQEAFRFRQTLLSIIGRQKNCIASSFSPVSSVCHQLPRFTIPQRCASPLQIVSSLVLEDYNSEIGQSYKESLFELLNHVQECAISNVTQMRNTSEQNLLIKQSCESCSKLPVFKISDSCLTPMEIITGMSFGGYSPPNVYTFKNSLLQVLRQVQECSSQSTKDSLDAKLQPLVDQETVKINQKICARAQLPRLEVPEDCMSPSDYVDHLIFYGYQPMDIVTFKQSLFQLISKFQTCSVSVSSSANVSSEAKTCQGLPKLPNVQDCMAPPEIINQMNLNTFFKWESNLFKQTLLELLRLQQKCCSFNSVKIVEKPVFVRIPVEVPKIMEQIREVPVRVPVLQPPKIIVKEVPIPQPPKIIIKQVPVLVPQPPRIITKEIPVPQTNRCKPIIQQVPVKVPVPIKIKVPVQVFVPVQKHCQLPNINIFDCTSPLEVIESIDLSMYNASDAAQFKNDILSLISIQRDCSQKVLTKIKEVPVQVVQKIPIYIPAKPEIIIKEVTQPTVCKCNLPDLSTLHGCVAPNSIESLVIPSACSHTDVIAFKETLWDILNAQKDCSAPAACPPPQSVIKQIPVPVPQPPKILIKEVPVFISPKNTSNVIVKEEPVQVPSPPRIIIKQIPVQIKVPVEVPVKVPVIQKQIVEVPKIVVKEVKVPVYVPVPVRVLQPPQIITKQVQVPVPQPPKIIVKQVPVLINKTTSKPLIIYKDRPVPVPTPPRIIVKERPVRVNVPVRIPVPVQVPVPQIVETRIPSQCHLPDIRINSCLDVTRQIDSLALSEYDSEEVMKFKQNLYTVLIQQRECVQCHLPEVNVFGCEAFEKQIEQLNIPGYTQWELQKFKQNILSLLLQQRNCLQLAPSSMLEICHLPNIDVVGCEELENQIGSLNISGFKLADVQQFKEKLFTMLLQQRKCSNLERCPINEVRIPVPQPPQVIVKQISVPVPQPPKIIYKEKPVIVSNCTQKAIIITKEKPVPIQLPSRTITKQVPVPIRVPVEVKVPVKVEVPVPMPSDCHLPKVSVNDCRSLQDKIQSLQMPGYDSSEVALFKQNLFDMLSAQRNCLLKEGFSEAFVKKCESPVYIRVPVRVEVPKEVIKEVIRQVPVRVNVPQPPTILIKQVPVPVPQSPKVIVKQVPIMTKCDHKPKIIIKEKPVLIPSPPRTLIKEVPVEIPVPVKSECHLPVIQIGTCEDIRNAVESLTMSDYTPEDVTRFKENILSLLIQQRDCIRCRLPRINVNGCDELEKQIDSLELPNYDSRDAAVFKQKLLSLLLEQQNCVGATMCAPGVVKTPGRVSTLEKHIEVPKEVPRYIIKEVKVPVYHRIPVQVPVIVKQIVEVPKEIIKEVIKEVPREVIKEVKVPVYQRVPVEVRVPVKQFVEVPKVVIKVVPKEVIKEVKVPVYIRIPVEKQVPVKQIVEVPREVVREVRIPVKQIIEVPKEVIKEVPIYQRIPIRVPVPVKQIVEVPKEIIKEVRVPVKQIVEVPREFVKEVVREIKVPVRVPVLQPPKILFKQVPIQVPQPPRVVIKQVPVLVKCDHKQNILVREKAVPVPSPPRTIVKEVPVKVPVPVRIPVPVKSQCHLPFVNINTCVDVQNEIASLEMADYDQAEVAHFKQKLLSLLMQQRGCVQCRLPSIRVSGCEELQDQIQSINLPNYDSSDVQIFKENFLAALLEQRNCVKRPECESKIVRVPVDRVRYEKIPVRVEVPKEVKVPVYQKIPVKVFVPIQQGVQVPKVIVKEVIKEVPVPVKQIVQVPKEFIKEIRIPVKQIVEVPKVIIKEVRVPVKQIVEVPKNIVKEVVKEVKVPVQQIVEVPKPFIKEIIKQVNVPVKQIVEVPKNIFKEVIKEVKVPVKEIVEVPKEVIKEIRIPVPVNVPVYVKQECHLPLLNIMPCEELEQQIQSLNIRGYYADEVSRFKKKLFSLLMEVQTCVDQDRLKDSVPSVPKCHLPRIGVYGCENLQDQISSWNLSRYSSLEIDTFKQDFLSLLLAQQECSCKNQPRECPTKTVQVPVDRPVYIKVPVPIEDLESVKVPGQVPVPQHPRIIIKKVPVYITSKPKVVIKEIPVEVPKEIVREVIRRVPVPVKQIVEVPREIVKEIRVPVQVPVPQPPKILLKQVTVPVPQPPKIIVKQVPIVITKCSQKPRIIIKEKPVPIQLPPRIITKEVPVRIKVPVPVKPYCHLPVINVNDCEDIKNQISSVTMSGFNSLEAEQFKQNLLSVLLRQRNCVQCHLPQINVGGCEELEAQINSLVFPNFDQWEAETFKQKLLAIILQQQNCVKNQPCLPKTHEVPVERVVYKRIPVRIPVIKQIKVPVEVPKIIVREVKVPVNVPVPVQVPSRPQIVIKQVPVSVPQPPKIIVKQVPIIISKCNQKPRIIVREKPVPVQLPPRTIVKQVPVEVKVPVNVPVQVPVKVPVRVPVPVKVLVPVKGECHLPVINLGAGTDLQFDIESLNLSGYDQSEVETFKQNLFNLLTKQRNCVAQSQVKAELSYCRLPHINIFDCDNLQEQINDLSLPGINSEDVQRFKQNLLSMLLKQRNCQERICETKIVKQPGDRTVYVRVPVKVPVEVPRVEIKRIEVPVNIPVPVQVPSPPQVLIKQVTVPVPQPPKVIFKQIPVQMNCDHKPKIIIKEKPVPVPSPPRIITKEVPVRINVPVKVPVQVRVPVPVEVPVPVKQECQLPLLNIIPCDKLGEQIQSLDILGYDVNEVSRFKQKLFLLLMQAKTCVEQDEITHNAPSGPKCHLPRIDLYGCENLQEQVSSWNLGNYSLSEIDSFKQDLMSLLLAQQKCSCINQPRECPTKIVQVPVDKPIYIKVPIQVPVPIKYPEPVPFDKVVEEPVEVPVQVPVPQPPKIIVKQVPVYITSKPRVLIKQVPVYVTPKTNVVIKQVPVQVPSPPRVIVKEVPVKVTVPIKVPVPVRVPVKVPVHVRVPFKVPVPVKYPVEKPVLVRVPVEVERIVTKVVEKPCSQLQQRVIEKPVYIRQPPQIVYKKVLVNTCAETDSKKDSEAITKQVPVYIKIPVPVRVPQIVEKIVYKKIIQQVPVPQPPQIIERTVPIQVQLPPKVIIKKVEVPVLNGTTCPPPKIIVEKIPVPQPPQIITKPVPVYVPPKVLFKEVPVPCTPQHVTPPTANIKRPAVCQNFKQALMRRLKSCASQLCFYRKIVGRLRMKMLQSLGSRVNVNLSSVKQPAVPIPMMHVMKSITPSIPLNPFQRPPTTIGVSSAAFVRDLHQVYKNTQQALAHCMDAILAQTLIQSQIKTKCNNCHQLIQDRELAENQIRFLNSIIVDIQKKNEEQRARIEILEAGCSAAMAEEIKLIGSAGRQIPPRMYCDICEEFDLHETEDCPKQNSDVVSANGQRGHKNVTERPYCEICEEFGHATEDCQEDHTF